MTVVDDAPGDEGLILALDQGTTNAKALLVDASGTVVASGSRPVGIRFPAPGEVEQDADDLWSATLAAAHDALAATPDAARRLAAISVSNQRESVVAWSRATGRPLGPVLGWQDARTAEHCAALDPALAARVQQRTGLPLDPMFSAPKMRWLLDAAGSPADDVRLGTVDSWLVHRLTGEHLAEAGNASRTLLLDLATTAWHDELLDAFGVPGTALGRVVASDAGFGRTTADSGLPVGVPVVAVLADSHAALYFHGCTTPGTGKATYGTGSSVMTPVADLRPAPYGIATTLAWVTAEGATYAREGNIVASGAALDWMAATLGAPGGTPGGRFLSALAAQVPDAGGVSFVPAFSGLAAPHLDRAAVGLVAGVTAGTTRAHLARAALEAVAHQVADVVEAIESDGAVHLATLRADGGATASDLLMSLQADLLGRELSVSAQADASALGAALLAAGRLGWPEPARSPARVVTAGLDPEARGARREAWAGAVARSRCHAVDPGRHR